MAKSSSTPSTDEYRFEAVLEADVMNYYHGVYVPFSVEAVFGTRGTVRVLASFNGIAAERALIPAGDGRHYLILSGDFRRRLGVRAGEKIAVQFVLDPRPADDVALPEELAAALEFEGPKAEAKYRAFTPGRRRSLNVYIDQAKRPETRIKRALEMARRIATDSLTAQQRAKKASSDAE